MLTSIIIPSYNALSHLRASIDSIRRHTSVHDYELIVVDNGSIDGTLDYLKAQRIITISVPSSTGYPIACNWGLRLARGDRILLLYPNVLVTSEWLTDLSQIYNANQLIGIVGPMVHYNSGLQQYQMERSCEESAVELQIKHNYTSQWEVVNRIAGFCMLFTRELMQKIGMLDERFTSGEFAGDDFCLRAHRAGYQLAVAKDVYVYSHGRTSFGHYFEEESLLTQNRQLFADKWGFDSDPFIDKGVKGGAPDAS